MVAGAAQRLGPGDPAAARLWEPKWFGPGTLPAIVVGVLGWRYAVDLAERSSWRRLLLVSYVVALAWLLALAFVDGSGGISRVLGSEYEYLPSARDVTDVSSLLSTYVDRIPLSSRRTPGRPIPRATRRGRCCSSSRWCTWVWAATSWPGWW